MGVGKLPHGIHDPFGPQKRNQYRFAYFPQVHRSAEVYFPFGPTVVRPKKAKFRIRISVAEHSRKIYLVRRHLWRGRDSFKRNRASPQTGIRGRLGILTCRWNKSNNPFSFLHFLKSTGLRERSLRRWNALSQMVQHNNTYIPSESYFGDVSGVT